MYFKVIKSGTSWKLVYDFLSEVYSNFCHITHHLWEIWLEIWPRSLTVVSLESCRVAMYIKCSEDSERKEWKSPFSRTTSNLAPPLQRTLANICINLILPETTFPGLHFCHWQYMGSSANFEQFCPKAGNANPLVAKPKTDFNAK